MIKLSNFSTGYGDRTLLDKVCATIPAQQLVTLIGRNGTGKSTLLRSMTGLKRSYKGKILVDGQEVSRMAPHELSKKIAFVSTGRVRIANMRCEDVVATGRAPYTNWIGRLQEIDRTIVSRSLAAVGMEAYARRSMDTMSDGECQRVMIARALAQDTPVILLDEPTSFLDMPNRYELAELLRHLAHDEGKCVIFSTHELDIALKYSDSIALIAPPKLIIASPDDMKASQQIQKTFGYIF